jgi:hypothetical protein
MTRPPCYEVMGGTLRRSKYVGFLLIGVGVIVMMGAAILPVSPTATRYGPFRVDIGGDNCGPAGVVVAREANDVCRAAARKRLLSTTPVALLIVALGMAMFAGGDAPHHSRVQVRTAPVRRRSSLRSPGSRRYKPG